jgi:AI-2 transport protein TqsA
VNERFQYMVYGTVFAIAVGWLLFIGRDILVPVVFSVLVVYVILGLARLLARIPVVGSRQPGKLHYAVSILLIVLALFAGASLLMSQLLRVAELAPQQLASLLATIQRGAVALGLESEPSWTSLRAGLLEHISLTGIASGTVALVVSLLGSLVVVSLYVAFLLLEQKVMPAKLEAIGRETGGGEQLQKILTHVNARIGTYLAMKTLISLLTALVSYVIMRLFGLEFAALWAVLIFFLNFIPYVGSWLSVLIPTLFALLQFSGDLWTVVAIAGVLSVAQFFLGNFLDPYLMANSLNLSGLAILVSLAAWAALWGIPGAFLAVPITACITMVLAEFKGTRPIAILMSRNGSVEDEA